MRSEKCFQQHPGLLRATGKSNNKTGFSRKLPWASSMIGALNVKCVSRYLYLFRSLLRTLILCIQRSFWQVLASAVPFLLPNPLCLPFLLASLLALTRDLEWTATGFLITSPSLISFLMLARELALAISLISLGSSHTWELMIVNFQQTNNKSALY